MRPWDMAVNVLLYSQGVKYLDLRYNIPNLEGHNWEVKEHKLFPNVGI